MKDKRPSGSWRTAWECLLASMAIALLTFVSFRLHAGPAMAALLFFFLVILISLWAGFLSTAFACAVAALCFVYFFTQPLYHLYMSEPVEIAATIAFAGTALIISRLLSRVRERTAELRQTNEQLQVDVTERKRAEEALRRSEAYLAEAQRLAHTGSWAWNPATRQSLYWSEEMFRIFGFNPQEGVPATEAFWQRIHPEDFERTYELLTKAAVGNMEYAHDHRIVLPDGTVKHIHAIGHPVLDENGEVAEYVGTAIDVTDRKRAEEERERLRQIEADLAHIDRVSMMGELAASIAHEVNQPLSGVVVNANACLRWLAGDSPNLDEAREAVRRIVRDGKRAGDVIARIRALATKTATAKERLDMNEAIQEAVALAQDELRKNRVAVRTEFAENLSPVLGDRVQLQQVVLNLVMNGIEAMSSVEERPRELMVRTRNDDAGLVRVTVRDSGRGLDAQSMERIFDAFYTTKHGGMGMGLAISRSIIQNHGGKLWAVANEGPGISVQFSIPKYQP